MIFVYTPNAANLLSPLPTSLSPSMSLFENSRGFQIYGGNFIAAAGDINIEQDAPAVRVNQQQLVLPPDEASHSWDWGTPVGDIWTGSSNTGVSGVQRRIRNMGETRHTPYHNSSRGQITHHAAPHRSEHTETSIDPYFHLQDWSRPYLSAPIPGIQGFNNFPIQGTQSLGGYRPPWWGPLQLELPATINGGTFVSHSIQCQGEKGISILHGTVALEALHDSAESFPQPRCHPETRSDMLEELQEWSLRTDPSSNVLWLHGPAGAGKSAIMQTLCRQLQDAGRLGGCFFFKRGHDTRGNATKLFATIAYQLALGVPWLKAPISQIVEDNPSIVARSIETQLQKLISEPCRLHNNRFECRDLLLILIDGLDECEGHDVHLEILRAIRNSLGEHLPLRFIIASRPEPHIQEMFESPVYHGSCHLFNVERSFADVRKYLCSEFTRIHHDHRTMANIPHPWPLPDVLDELVEKSSGYFIYASTIIKFIDDRNYRPTERLAIVTDQDSAKSDSAFGSLNQLYMTVLSTAPRQAQLIPILCALANFGLSPLALDILFEVGSGDARLVLRGVSSVLDVPLKDDDEIAAHHATFYDFLHDSGRSQIFYVGSLDHRMDLARSFLKLFACQFKYIGGLYQRSSENLLIPFITSLPPSVELLPLIQAMNPDYIFELEKLEMLIPWMEVSFIPFSVHDDSDMHLENSSST
ncbi:hypothetical protein BT96DRAFT_311649 [Gymnopus androsaceus JB14]|uniref:Nephrocystin 3-like N-terminal domain-containing protein n=1 Tax=Gymnopus androsaceus JB14 TaxID=1447944 RepID=A0A6A4H1P9_9AGAR|nr:hypothetical protein BT96DRAFT_311649 [Gymnopus androsaceus JB14]